MTQRRSEVTGAAGETQRGAVVHIRGVEAWHRHVSETLMPLFIEGEDFEASVTEGAFSGVRLAVIRTGAHVAQRTQRLAAEGDPYFWLALQIEGESSLEQGAHSTTLRPGDFVLYDSTLPYRREFPGESLTLVALIPQQLITLPPHALAVLAGVRLGSHDGLGAIVSAYLLAVARNLEALTPGTGPGVVHAMVELLVSTLAQQFGVVAPARVSRRLEQVMAIREWIMLRLGDPGLDPAQIADAHFISLRQLHVLFREQGTTVGTWMRERRLDMARRDLETPGESAGIATISQRWGFSDPAYFTRAFRHAFGMAPREYRAAASAQA